MADPRMTTLDLKCPNCDQPIRWVSGVDSQGRKRPRHEGNVRIEWRDGFKTVVCGLCNHPISVIVPAIQSSAGKNGKKA